MSSTQPGLFPNPLVEEGRRTTRRNFVTFLLTKRCIERTQLTPEMLTSIEVLCDPAHTTSARFNADIRVLLDRANAVRTHV